MNIEQEEQEINGEKAGYRQIEVDLNYSSNTTLSRRVVTFEEIIDAIMDAIEMISRVEMNSNSKFEDTFKKLRETDEMMLSFLKTGLSKSPESSPKPLPNILHYNFKEQLGSLLNVIPKLQSLEKYETIHQQFREKVLLMKELLAKFCSVFKEDNSNDLEDAYKELAKHIKEFAFWCWDMYLTDCTR